MTSAGCRWITAAALLMGCLGDATSSGSDSLTGGPNTGNGGGGGPAMVGTGGATGAPTLTLITGAAEPACLDVASALIGFSGSVITTGGIGPTTITASIDGGVASTTNTLTARDWVHDGRTKTAAYAFTLQVPNGTHTVTVCVDQPGSDTSPANHTCATVEVTVACATACGDAEPFGDIASNPSLCRGNGPPHVPVHVRGDFGDAPSLDITGPGGYAHAAAMRHAGESCNYHYNWDTAGNGGAGTYRFHVAGNGHTLDFTADLRCN